MLLAVVILFVAVPAWADFEAGKKAYLRGDYATALKEWRPLAEQGDAGAQFRMGEMYQSGKGLPQNHAEAARWFLQAAKRGHVDAQFRLAKWHQVGHAVDVDQVEAARWLRKAAYQVRPTPKCVPNALA